MAVVSSKTLFHFTSKIQYLAGILENGFIPRYCLENLSFAGKKIKGIAIPMVSFCDIPLTSIGNHTEKYGRYALGISKEWALEIGLNPVLYLREKSLLINHFRKLYTKLGKMDIDDDEADLLVPSRDILCFIKPYEGPFSREFQKYNEKSEVFYNEREWRFVPSLFDSKVSPWLSKDKFEALKSKDASPPIYFDSKDINYIIVSNDNDIGPTIKAIKEINSNIPEKEKEKLYSRILTVDQIHDDF